MDANSRSMNTRRRRSFPTDGKHISSKDTDKPDGETGMQKGGQTTDSITRLEGTSERSTKKEDREDYRVRVRGVVEGVR